MMSTANSGRLVFLDYMRALAFISVLIGHKFYAELVHASNDDSLHITVRYFFETIKTLCFGGAAGVVVFFLTSGFIITHVLQKETSPDFVIKRIFRIYPLYIFAVGLEAWMDWTIQSIPLPEISVMLPRLLLIGDFFGIPNALAGVEWTLRIEVLFYAFMAIVKAAGVFSTRNQKLLPAIYLIIALILFISPAFPATGQWNAAYVNSYSVFLFMGSLIYLHERNLANKQLCTLTAGVLISLFLFKIAEVQPNWKESNYAIAAVAIFYLSHKFRHKFVDGPILRTASDLTFSVYLFHNWLWGYIDVSLEPLATTGLAGKLVTTLVLLIVCYALNKTVERAGLEVGKTILKLRYQPIVPKTTGV